MSGKSRSSVIQRYFNREVVMKIIQTNNYLKKIAQPVEFNLKPGVTDKEISEHFDGGEDKSLTNQKSEFEKNIDWATETENLINAGYDVQGLPQKGIGAIRAYYTYDAEIFGEDVTISNILPLRIETLMGRQYQPLIVSEPATKEGIFSGLKEEIAEQEQKFVEENKLDLEEPNIIPDTREELY